MHKPKIGILGAGTMAQYHLDGFRDGGAEVVAIADTKLEAARTFAARTGIPFYCSSLDEMLTACPDLEAVSVVVPNAYHMPFSVQALSKGLHVYCEKPPALNASEMRMMLDAAKKSQKTLMFDFNNRARAESVTMRRYIKDGVVGKINSIQATWIRRNGIPGFGGWFTNKAQSGGGAVIDLPHMLDLALHFLDYPKPAYVTACVFDDFMGDPAFKGPWGAVDISGGITDVETACHGFVVFQTGQCLSLRTSWAEMNEREIVSVQFQGTNAGGKLERLFEIDGVDETAADTCSLYTVENGLQVNRSIQIPKDDSMGRLNNAAGFVRALTGDAQPLNTPEEALTLMQIIDALYKSADDRRPVIF